MIPPKLKLKPQASAPRHDLFLLLLFLVHPHLGRPFVPSAASIRRAVSASNSISISTMSPKEGSGVGLRPSKVFSPPPQTSPCGDGILPTPIITRRLVVAGILSTFVAGLRPAAAFDNGIPEMVQYSDKPKYPGTRSALGLQGDGKLSLCDSSPNCFSTSGDESHLLELWKPKSGSKAMGELLETIKTYPPGQARIDRGGFSIIDARSDYLYVQFESMKHGFIDDVEFAVRSDGKVQVRSSSRIGFLDLGVNGKRLNYISAQLRDKGWTAPAITPADYPDYFPMMPFSYDDYVRSVLSPEDCPVPSNPLECKDPSPRRLNH